MSEVKALVHTLNTIQDKHPYTHKLAYELCLGNHEFMERKFYELCFVLYIRFQMEKLSPQVIYQYFLLLQRSIHRYPELEQNPSVTTIINLGLELGQFNENPTENFSLTNTMLKINYQITAWQNTNHICKYCGHNLSLLTQEMKTLPRKITRARRKVARNMA